MLGIRDGDPYLQCPVLLVDRGVEEVKLAGERLVGAVCEPNVKRWHGFWLSPCTVLEFLLELE